MCRYVQKGRRWQDQRSLLLVNAMKIPKHMGINRKARTAALTPCEPAQDKKVKINFKAKAKKRYQWQPSSSSNMLPRPPSPHHYSVSKKKKIKSSSFVRMGMGKEMNSSDAATGEVEQRVSAKYEGYIEKRRSRTIRSSFPSNENSCSRTE